jgi:hypothetical protein
MSPAGETDLWTACAPRALLLPAGSRAVFIATAQCTPLDAVEGFIRRLVGRGIHVDCVLIDEREFMRIYNDQGVDIRDDQHLLYKQLARVLAQAGARVFPLSRRQPDLRKAQVFLLQF